MLQHLTGQTKTTELKLGKETSEFIETNGTVNLQTLIV